MGTRLSDGQALRSSTRQGREVSAVRRSRYCSSTCYLSEDVMKRTDSVCLDGYTGCMCWIVQYVACAAALLGGMIYYVVRCDWPAEK